MSDPKATKMTLEEAVEIVEQGDPMGWLERPPNWQERRLRWIRARAIVDQAVKAHEARDEVRRVASGLQDGDLQCEGGLQGFEVLCRADEDEFEKLRALERGESEVQP